MPILRNDPWSGDSIATAIEAMGHIFASGALRFYVSMRTEGVTGYSVHGSGGNARCGTMHHCCSSREGQWNELFDNVQVLRNVSKYPKLSTAAV